MQNQYYTRLPVKYAFNIRDLGGYAAEGKAITQWHRFLRADDLCNLDGEDIIFLLEYGVTAVMDLRSVDETIQNQNPFESFDGVAYKNVSLMSETVSDVTKIVIDHPIDFIPNFYLNLIKNCQKAICEIVEFFAQQKDGCILFHCAAGKDRTGMIAMLLLGLCGVSKFDIIANYETTYSYLRNNAVLMAGMAQMPMDVMYSKMEYIEPVIDYILKKYGDFRNYLVDIGIKEDSLNKIQERML